MRNQSLEEKRAAAKGVVERMHKLLGDQAGRDARRSRIRFGYTPEEAEEEIRSIEQDPQEGYMMEDGFSEVSYYTKKDMIDMIRRNIRR